MVKIKICGITREEEALFLNENQVEYAGFVLYEKSKRYLTYAKAKSIFNMLNRDIKKVAVAVSPDIQQMREMEQAGFDVIQIHGNFDKGILTQTKLPVWLASNISGMQEIRRWPADTLLELERKETINRLQFVLAGGLNAVNAASGIRLFGPDIVDVSSGVEEIRDGTVQKSRKR